MPTGMQKKPKSKHGVPLQFLNEIANARNSNECIQWPFARAGKGYGHLRQGSKMVYAHRLICEMVHGPAPSPKHQAAHSCGHGFDACVNPRHLRWATQKENDADKAKHGTQNRGERHGIAKLTEKDVRKIRIALSEGHSQLVIANDFGVSTSTIGRIARGECWGWLRSFLE